MSAPLRIAARELWELRRDNADAFERAIASLPDADLDALASCWQLHARAKQLRPADCKQLWLLQWGRATGKTRSAAENTLDTMEDWGRDYVGALVSKTVGDVRDVMIEGVSGLKACAARRGYEIKYTANRALVEHPSGARAHVMSAETEELGRGPNLNDFWADEIAAWPRDSLTRFQVFLMAVRLPAPTRDGKPRGTITTTPKPNAIMQWLLRSKATRDIITVSRAATRENTANVDASMLFAAFGDTRLGLQELEGELLESAALVTPEIIDLHRVRNGLERYSKGVVAIDPGIRKNEKADETGIIAAARDDGNPAHAYVLADESMQGASFAEWARAAVELCLRLGFETIVTEINQGGDAVVDAIKAAIDECGDPRALRIEVVPIWATTSKRARAETVAPRYERGRVHHVGHFPQLETEWATWAEGAPSPNRLDAAVYALSHLLLSEDESAPFWTPY